ncbi:MAG: aldo/keto reductase [Acidimicrobiia bacterium]|nr:aldo/keto reductase [Acidimicrobiia bacterium]
MTRTELRPAIVLGTAQLTRPYGVLRSEGSHDEGRRLLRRAVSLGVSALDTAPGYGEAEELIAAEATSTPVFTRLAAGVDPKESLRQSLGRLGRSEVELLYFHDPEALVDPDLVERATTLVSDGTAALGAAIYDPELLRMAADDPRIAAVQVPANLLDRRFTPDLLQRAADSGTAVHTRSVLLQGVLLRQPSGLPPSLGHLAEFVAAFDRAAAELGRPKLELAIGWVRSQPNVNSIVLGASSVSEFDALWQAATVPPLDQECLDVLTDLPCPPADAVDPRRW